MGSRRLGCSPPRSNRNAARAGLSFAAGLPIIAAPVGPACSSPAQRHGALEVLVMRVAERLLVFGAFLALTPSMSHAEKFAGPFLAGGAGARALGMGNAYTAVANDASAIYWNPAGLASTNFNEILLSHEFRFGDLVDYSFGGGIYQVKQRNGRLAVGVIRLGVDNIAFPDSSLWRDLNGNHQIDPGEFDYDEVRHADKVKMVNDAEYGFFLSYAQPAGRYQLGGSLKLIRQSVGEFTSFGLGVDAGLMRRDLFPNLDLGLTLHDLTGTYLSWSTGRKETISTVPRLGLAYRLPGPVRRHVLHFEWMIEAAVPEQKANDDIVDPEQSKSAQQAAAHRVVVADNRVLHGVGKRQQHHQDAYRPCSFFHASYSPRASSSPATRVAARAAIPTSSSTPRASLRRRRTATASSRPGASCTGPGPTTWTCRSRRSSRSAG